MCIAEILNNLAEAHTTSNWQSQDLNVSPLYEKAYVLHSKACASNHKTRWEWNQQPCHCFFLSAESTILQWV